MEDSKHPVQIVSPHPEHSSRWLALATLLFTIPKLILLIPHLVILYFLGIVMLVVAAAAQIVVLVTGKYPQGMYEMVHGTFQWQIRANFYLLGLTDKYPPFSLK